MFWKGKILKILANLKITMKIFIYRKGALGDTLSFLPLLFSLKRTYTSIYFAGNYLYRTIFYDLDFIKFIDADSKIVFDCIYNLHHFHFQDVERFIFFTNDNLEDSHNRQFFKALPEKSWFYKYPFDCLNLDFNSVYITMPVNYFSEFESLIKSKYVIIHPGSGGLRKVWPLEYFFEVENYLYDYGIKCIYLLGENEERYLPMMKKKLFFHNLSFKKIIFLLTYAITYVGCDSGISHLAGILNVPGLALFGPSSEIIYKPWGKIKVIKSKTNIIEDIKPDKVIKELGGILEDR